MLQSAINVHVSLFEDIPLSKHENKFIFAVAVCSLWMLCVVETAQSGLKEA